MKQGVDQQAIQIKALKEENKRMEIELNLAKDIQLRMIPDGNPPIAA
jgi:hypothetical protein